MYCVIIIIIGTFIRHIALVRFIIIIIYYSLLCATAS